ncbi:MAG TPA: HAD family hydrolase [Solirubrobacterales bacterium]|nr:HAD family hydrolase [Solirubrobacterales bacterium]
MTETTEVETGTAFDRRPLDTDPGPADVVAAPALGHATLAPVRELLESDAIEVVSTDIFDTLVWRRTLNPTDAFLDLGERLVAASMLAPSLSSGSFANLRRLAEERVRADRKEALGDSEVTLGEIYGGFGDWVFAGHPAEAVLELEIELERELIVPDLDVVELLREVAARGKTIVAISDIYFSADQIRSLFGQPELGSLPFRRIFTSSDHREGKTGRLFDIALAALGCDPAQMVHIGDNLKSDIEPAEERGIRTVFLEKRSAAFEAMLDREEMFGRPALWRETTATTSRRRPGATVDFGLTALRAKMDHRDEIQRVPTGLRAHWRFGATVLGPALAGFGEWVHERAREMGAGRVHCLMREGEFLTRFVAAAGPGASWPVEAMPLWLSRFVATRAAIGEADERELERLMFGVTPPTVAQFCHRLGLQPSDIAGLSGHSETRLHDPIIRRLVLDAILEDAALRGRIVEDSRRLRDRVVRSLQETAPGDGPIVVVDIGWGATIQQRLTEALGHAGVEREVAGLYLMTNEIAGYAISRGHRIHGFVTDNGFPDHMSGSVMRAPEIIEQSLMPEFGTQLGLNEELGPILDVNHVPAPQLAEAAAVRQGAFAFQREYVRYRTVLPSKLVSLAEAPEALGAVLTRAVVSPTAEEVTAFSGWVHDENFGVQGQTPLIDERWSAKIGYLTPRQLGEQPMHEMYWPFGVAHRYDEQLGELAAVVAAGELSWDATSTPLETGVFEVRATEGVGLEAVKPFREVPERNRRGLSYVSGSIGSHQIGALQIKIAERGCVMRIDWFEFRLFAQGEADPIVMRFEGSDAIQSLVAANCLVLPAGLVICTGSPALLNFNVAAVTGRIVSRVEFETGFAVLPGGPVLPGSSGLEGMLRPPNALDRFKGTAAWRTARPLRDATKRALKRRPSQ